MTPRFEIVTGEGRTYGPFNQRELREFAATIPAWICWAVRVAGCND